MKNEKSNIFWTFSGKYGKMSKKVKKDQKGSYFLKKAQIDEKWEKQYFLDFFKENMEKCQKSEKWSKRAIYCWKRP